MEVSAIVYVAETCSPERLAFRMSFLMPFMYFGIYAPKFIHIFFLQNLLSINEQNEILIIIAIAIIFFYLSKYFPEYTEYLNNENGKLDIDRDLPKNDFTHIELSISSDQKNTLQGKDKNVFIIKNTISKHIGTLKSILILLFLYWFLQINSRGLRVLLNEIRLNDLGLNSETDYVLKISDVIALISSIVAVIFTKKFKQEKVLMVSGIGILILCGAGALYEYIFLNVPGQFKPTRFCLIPVICIWLSEALIIVGLWTNVILITGNIFSSKIRGIILGLVWAIVIIEIYVIDVYIFSFKISILILFILFAGNGLKIYFLGLICSKKLTLTKIK